MSPFVYILNDKLMTLAGEFIGQPLRSHNLPNIAQIERCKIFQIQAIWKGKYQLIYQYHPCSYNVSL